LSDRPKRENEAIIGSLDKQGEAPDNSFETVQSPWSYHFTDKLCLYPNPNKGICDERFGYEAHFHAFTQDKEEYWKSMTPTKIKIIQDGLKQHLDEFDDNNIPKFNGRGIVFSSNSQSLRMVFVSISFIRSYGCELPIEIWYY
jgi:hypothetical protein